MSDYMFILESHLSTEQIRALAAIQEAAQRVNLSIFLAGGAMRDMLGGFPIRDLDFTLEANPLKLSKSIAEQTGAEILSVDENRKAVELKFPGGVTAQIAMARQEVYPKPGAKPRVTPATIHDDLHGRDFTINAIALSLNRASRGLLIDPTNGVSDLEQRQLRAIRNHSLYDDPVRMLRLIRLKVRLGFGVDERAENQYRNAREAHVEKYISPQALLEELRRTADEPNAGEVLRVLAEENLLSLYSPLLTGAKLNLAGFQKLQRLRQLLPFGIDLRINNLALFLNLLTEKLTPKERASLAKSSGLTKAELGAWQKLEGTARKLEKELKSSKIQKPSHIYQVLSEAPGEDILFLLYRSGERIVQDRIKNYLQKYVVTAQDVSDAEVAARGVQPGTPKFDKLKQQMILARLDARPKKAPPVEAPPEPAHAPAGRR